MTFDERMPAADGWLLPCSNCGQDRQDQLSIKEACMTRKRLAYGVFALSLVLGVVLYFDLGGGGIRTAPGDAAAPVAERGEAPTAPAQIKKVPLSNPPTQYFPAPAGHVMPMNSPPASHEREAPAPLAGLSSPLASPPPRDPSLEAQDTDWLHPKNLARVERYFRESEEALETFRGELAKSTNEKEAAALRRMIARTEPYNRHWRKLADEMKAKGK